LGSTGNLASWSDFIADLESRQRQVSSALEAASRAELGQFLTPSAVAQFMAGMFSPMGG